MGGVVALLLIAIEIHAASGCPGAAEIERQLAPLLGPGPEAHTTDVARIGRGADGALLVALDDARGGPIAERQLPPAGTCRDQAETVAVTLAIWEAQIHPGDLAAPRQGLSPDAAGGPTTLATTPAPPPPRRPWTTALGAAVAGDAQSGAWAPAGRPRAVGGPRGQLVFARACPPSASAACSTEGVTPGEAAWWRAFLALGVDAGFPARGRRWSVALGAAAAGGVAVISGAGYAVNRGTAQPRPRRRGGSLRGGLRLGRVRPWLGVSAVGWLRRQELELQGIATSGGAAPLGADGGRGRGSFLVS